MRRRTFLTSSALMSLAAPFVLRARRAQAEREPVAKNLVVFFKPNGTILGRARPALGDMWTPRATSTGLDFTRPAGVTEAVSEEMVTAPYGRTICGVRAADHLLFMRGLSILRDGSHEGNFGALLTGDGGEGDETGGESIDFFAGARLPPLPVPRFTPTLYLATRLNSYREGFDSSLNATNVISRQRTQVGGRSTLALAVPQEDPQVAFDRLFGTTATTTAGGVRIDSATRRRALDLVRDDVRDLKRRISRAEQQKLDLHLQRIDDYASRLDATGGAPALGDGACTDADYRRGATAERAENDGARNADAHIIASRQAELAALALASGKTRVVTLQHLQAVPGLSVPWLDVPAGHHDASHAQDADFMRIERWWAEQLSYGCGSPGTTDFADFPAVRAAFSSIVALQGAWQVQL